MKANELMIGDWVRTEHDSTPRQIDWIRTGEVGLLWNKVVTPPYLVPIPLTPEILEKNGWKRTKYAYGRDCMELQGDYDEELPDSIDNALSIARWSFDKDYQHHFLELYMWKGNVMLHDCHYIHQLQHVFRLFGIEKEIEL